MLCCIFMCLPKYQAKGILCGRLLLLVYCLFFLFFVLLNIMESSETEV
ncbi:hypothetical protein L581_0817 [Serratia fonticola AU-AP2C]|nr:hypothetical protein L581_0817 [Serratia fonticola AU-AP2C]